MQDLGTSKRNFILNHSPLNVVFNKNSDNFAVKEIPLYEFSGDGEHLILNIQKKDISTNELLEIISSSIGVKIKEIGYAGLKDKLGFTSQFISLPFKFKSDIGKINHPKIKILNEFRHKNKLKIGHLKGNHFFIKFKKVNSADASKLINILEFFKTNGFANYFGYQRFGRDKNNAKLGEDILNKKLLFRNKKLNKFLINALQSELFNAWLSKRVEISKIANSFNKKEFKEIFKFDKKDIDFIYSQENFFKILDGDVFNHYPFGKNFLSDDLVEISKRFIDKNISVTGLLVGKKVLKPKHLAKDIEDEIFSDFYEIFNSFDGQRRIVWIYPDELSFKYNPLNAQFSLSFSLIKGAYATTLIEEILH